MEFTVEYMQRFHSNTKENMISSYIILTKLLQNFKVPLQHEIINLENHLIFLKLFLGKI